VSTPTLPDFSSPKPVHGLAPGNEQTRCGLDARTNGGGVPNGFRLLGVTCPDCLRSAEREGVES
jgi:hypothetical protein